jgi:hypothetical protein
MTDRPGVHPAVLVAVVLALLVWAVVVGLTMWSGAWAP